MHAMQQTQFKLRQLMFERSTGSLAGASDMHGVLCMQTAYRLIGQGLLPWTESDQNEYQAAFMSLLVRLVTACMLFQKSVAASP